MTALEIEPGKLARDIKEIARRHPELRQGNWRGTWMPEHVQVAYGRAVFRLLHGRSRSADLIWLVDLPSSLEDLATQYPLPHAWFAYCAECQRVGMAVPSGTASPYRDGLLRAGWPVAKGGL
jgi:hypothetical protein